MKASIKHYLTEGPEPDTALGFTMENFFVRVNSVVSNVWSNKRMEFRYQLSTREHESIPDRIRLAQIIGNLKKTVRDVTRRQDEVMRSLAETARTRLEEEHQLPSFVQEVFVNECLDIHLAKNVYELPCVDVGHGNIVWTFYPFAWLRQLNLGHGACIGGHHPSIVVGAPDKHNNCRFLIMTSSTKFPGSVPRRYELTKDTREWMEANCIEGNILPTVCTMPCAFISHQAGVMGNVDEEELSVLEKELFTNTTIRFG